MKNICIITTAIGKGGAERFSGLLSQMLFQIGYNVHIVTTKNIVDYEFSGTLYNLEEEIGKQASAFKKLKALRKYFKKYNFHAIIDNRTRPSFFKEYIIYNFVFKSNIIIPIVHSYYLQKYLPSFIFLAKSLYNKTKIVAVSREIQKELIVKYGFSNCKQIYNPADLESITKKANEQISVNDKYILFYGRIDEKVKNLTLLLRAYKNSLLISRNVKLYILGEGYDLPYLKGKIKELKLDSYVNHVPYIENPFPYVKKAFFTTLTSRHEGFPMVLIESLSCGTPVISVDCKSGPNEIIKHQYNGLLVENHNQMALANAFNSFVEDDLLYSRCKENTKTSVEQFSIEKITKGWGELLK